jgi:voltage-gated potassium channel
MTEEKQSLKHTIHEIIFEADTFWGRVFDIGLLIAIVLSVVSICLESMIPEIPGSPTALEVKQFRWLRIFEWTITIGFTIEYLLRLYSVSKPSKYAWSFYGIVDLLAILPTFLQVLLGVGSSLTVVRALRLLRIFRIFKLVNLLSSAEELAEAIWRARSKVIVFISVVVIAITIAGAAMYEIEGNHRRGMEDSNFKSIPHGMYWATVTMTTVGYGDLVPQTRPGKVLATFLILLGYSLIIVPTGFVSAEFMRTRPRVVTTQSCRTCVTEGHDLDAKFCKFCSDAM